MADLFDIVAARKLSGGGGGGGTTVEALSVTQNGTYTAPSGKAYSPVTVNVSGGSSDFSTATVTLVTSLSRHYCSLFGEIMDVATLLDYPTPLICISTNDTEIIDNSQHTLALYEGKTYASFSADLVTTAGNATAESYDQGWLVTITGDCTITIS